MAARDLLVLGSGPAARTARTLLQSAGFSLGIELDDDERCPVLLGETGFTFATVMSLVHGGRHLLVGSPPHFSAVQLETLLAARKPRQVVGLWSDRRFHPGHRLVAGLVEADEQGWRPRYLRQATRTSDRPTSALMRWRTLETLGLVLDLVKAPLHKLAAMGSSHPLRGSLDQLALMLTFEGVESYIQVSLGEVIERRETVLVAIDRRAYIDELNPAVPVRLVDDEPPAQPAARWVSCPSPDAVELAKQQCIAFLEATRRPPLAEAEAGLWTGVLAAWRAAEASLGAGGEPRPVAATAGLRVIEGTGPGASAPAGPGLRLVYGS